jgi:hypothetical protein
VLDPVMALEAGLWDAGPTLANYLLDCPHLRLTCLAQAGLANWAAFQHRVTALLIVYGEQSEILVPGFMASLVDVSVTMQPILRAPDQPVGPVPTPYPETPSPEPEPEPVFQETNYTWDVDR